MRQPPRVPTNYQLFSVSLWDLPTLNLVESVTEFAVRLVSSLIKLWHALRVNWQVAANAACLHGCVDVLLSNILQPQVAPGTFSVGTCNTRSRSCRKPAGRHA